MTQTLENCIKNETTQRTFSLPDLENECISQMNADGFYNIDLPIDISGNRVDFDGRGMDSSDLEWYIASMKSDGTLLVTYNSHHSSLHRDKNFVFFSKSKKPFSEKEAQEMKERVIEWQQESERLNAEKEQDRYQKALKDQVRFNRASKTGTSPYLGRKQVSAHGIRFEIRGEETIVLVPMQDENGELQALQEIYPTKKPIGNNPKLRDKNFTNATKGLFHVIGNAVDGKEIRVSEGYATAVSIYESTGCETPHVVAFSAYSYQTVIPIIRKLYPNSPILICADNNNLNNPSDGVGVKEAKKAADLVGNCSVVYPVFPEGENNADFNDLMIVSGKEEVKRQVEQSREDTQTDSVALEDQSEEFASGSGIDDTVKAKASARRKALNFKMCHEIIDDISKQYPAVKDQAEDLAKKAIEWAKKQQIGCIVKVKGISKKITDLKSLNERFAQLEAPCQPCVTIRISDGKALASTDLTNLLSSEVVVSGVNNKGDPNYISASTYWKGDAFKKIYRKIAFTSKPVSEDTYNLFTGFGVKPKQGKCEKILNHIEEVLCAGNKVNSLAFIKKTAWEVQNIGEPSRVPVLLKSEQHQTGKGIYLEKICLPMFGNSGFKPEGLEQLIGRFNDPMRGKAFIYLDEVLFAGDIKSADKIKSLVTAKYLGIESKGLQTVQAPIGVNLYLTTNHEGAAYIEELDERYWILEVSPDKYGDDEYFKELLEEVENGGLQAFLYYLLNLDVSDFLPWRDVPKDNEFKDKMIRDSVNPYDARKWVEECCHARMILGLEIKTDNTNGVKCPYEPWETGTEYENGLFLIAYTNWQKTVRSSSDPKPTKSNSFGELLNNLGFIARVDKQRYRKLPDPDKCLESLVELPKIQKEKQRKKRK